LTQSCCCYTLLAVTFLRVFQPCVSEPVGCRSLTLLYRVWEEMNCYFHGMSNTVIPSVFMKMEHTLRQNYPCYTTFLFLYVHCLWRSGLCLTFWHRNYFFFNFRQPVYKMWIIRERNTLELWNKLHFEEEKNVEFIPCLKYSVAIFVE
jgi:hypothetical protein